eukprot:PLAT6754.1.p1 GENE.PLAT6754.1~~PLAT6754.1.p1  ORF type:complete len:246 (-),score=96.40 PLAT6754.1:101-838(-)
MAVLTNFRSKHSCSVSEPASRGQMLLAALEGPRVVGDLAASGADWELEAATLGFNLLVVELNEERSDGPSAYFVTNGHSAAEGDVSEERATVRRCEDGVHVFSNSTLDDDSWPKVKGMRAVLEERAARWAAEEDGKAEGGDEMDAERAAVDSVLDDIEAALFLERDATDDELPDLSFTSLTEEVEAVLQRNAFVRPGVLPVYGTRTQTVLLASATRVWYATRSTEDWVEGAAFHAWTVMSLPRAA